MSSGPDLVELLGLGRQLGAAVAAGEGVAMLLEALPLAGGGQQTLSDRLHALLLAAAQPRGLFEQDVGAVEVAANPLEQREVDVASVECSQSYAERLAEPLQRLQLSASPRQLLLETGQLDLEALLCVLGAFEHGGKSIAKGSHSGMLSAIS